MIDYSSIWSTQSHSGNRSNTYQYLEQKASETQAVLKDYCGYSSESIVDLGCGAGELLEHLVARINIVKATDYSASMLSAARTKLADEYLYSTLKFICDGVNILPALVEEFWISTGALSQYSSRDQLELIISSFQHNKAAKHLVLFDTIDPVRYFILPLISYGNYISDATTASNPKTYTNGKSFGRVISCWSRILKVALFRPLISLLNLSKLLLSLLVSSRVFRLPGSLMGYGVLPSFWSLTARRCKLKVHLVSSRVFEYRYHVVISK